MTPEMKLYVETNLEGTNNYYAVCREDATKLHGVEFFNPDLGWVEFKGDAKWFAEKDSAACQVFLLQSSLGEIT